MGRNTSIEWTDHTFNPWIGCTKISEGCRHCYAAAHADRFFQGTWGPHGIRRPCSPKAWDEVERWERHAAKEGKPHLVFSGSMCDLFENCAQDTVYAGRLKLFSLIDRTPNLIWLLVTKRPENIVSMLPRSLDCSAARGGPLDWLRHPRPNVMFLTSVEDQASADKRIIDLLKVPAAMRGLSVEPLLEPTYLKLELTVDDPEAYAGGTCRIGDLLDWIIVGGESGVSARPCNISWIADIGRQAQMAFVPLFTKQLGSKAEIGDDCVRFPTDNAKGGDPAEWPTFTWAREFPDRFRRQ